MRLVGLRGQTAGILSVRTPRSRAGTHRGCPARKAHIDGKRISVSSLYRIWSHWGPMYAAFQAGQDDKWKKNLFFDQKYVLFLQQLTNKHIRIPAQRKSDTTCVFSSFYDSSIRSLQILFSLSAICGHLSSFPLSLGLHSSSSFTYASFSVHHLSLPSSPPSALRLNLCWMQPETHSPLLFPGSCSLCFQAWPGKTLSSPLPLGVTISSPPWLSQVLTLSVSHINAQHADSHIQYRLE